MKMEGGESGQIKGVGWEDRRTLLFNSSHCPGGKTVINQPDTVSSTSTQLRGYQSTASPADTATLLPPQQPAGELLAVHGDSLNTFVHLGV